MTKDIASHWLAICCPPSTAHRPLLSIHHPLDGASEADRQRCGEVPVAPSSSICSSLLTTKTGCYYPTATCLPPYPSCCRHQARLRGLSPPPAPPPAVGCLTVVPPPAPPHAMLLLSLFGSPQILCGNRRRRRPRGPFPPCRAADSLPCSALTLPQTLPQHCGSIH